MLPKMRKECVHRQLAAMGVGPSDPEEEKDDPVGLGNSLGSLEKQHFMPPPPSVPATSSSSTTSTTVAIPSVSLSLFRQALVPLSYVYTLPTTAPRQ